MLDESFLRHIINKPGDDAVRLIYADWLEERSDSRAAYLRAEAAWAQPWKNGRRPEVSPEVRALAAGLDPVWIARVSRPPVGVCCEHLWPEAAQEDSSVPLSSEEVDGFEQKIGAAIPPDYRAFLLNYNGGYPEPGEILLPHVRVGRGQSECVEIEIFRAVRDSRRREYSGEIISGRRHQDAYVGNSSVRLSGRVLGTAVGDQFEVQLGLEGEAAGKIFAENDDWDNDGMVYALAGSLPAFLALLRPVNPSWARIIIRGEVTAFAEWLATATDINVRDRKRRTPLEIALLYKRYSLAELLLGRGAQVTPFAWDLATYFYGGFGIRNLVHDRCPRRPG